MSNCNYTPEANDKTENLIIQVESLNRESLNKEESYRNMRTEKNTVAKKDLYKL